MSSPIPAPQPKGLPPWPESLIAILVGSFAAFLVWPQIFPGPERANEANLPNLDKRATALREITDPVQRDSFCVGLSAYGRQLDQHIAKDAHVFLSGIVGKENGGRGGYYYFLRNYLFPRELEISLDRKGIFTYQDGFKGVDATSLEELRTNGFDLLIKIGTNDSFSLQPITEKGVPKP
ncbi:MAG: hypothetical protein WCH99_03705 [Verrucomicrobiota bacterium]